MSEFSMLDEIEKYLLEIFENKAKSREPLIINYQEHFSNLSRNFS